MIELRDVSKSYLDRDDSEVIAVEHLSLIVREGEMVALIGPSGCGKTTTMKMVNRLIEPTRGQVLVDDTDIRERDVIALRRCIGYVVQSGGLFPHMTVAGNIGLLCELENWDQTRIESRVAELLELVNLPAEQFAARYPRELSGGQRQRVGVARALAIDPPYILMDEPFGALDPISRDQVHEEFLELKGRVKKTIILVTHDMAEAFKLADRVALMELGRIVQVGTEGTFRESPENEFVRRFLHAHLGGAVA